MVEGLAETFDSLLCVPLDPPEVANLVEHRDRLLVLQVDRKSVGL